MKKVYSRVSVSIFLSLFLSTGRISAQSVYHPMLDSLTWVSHFYNFTGDWNTWYYSHGDTIIGGNSYKMYYTGAYLREDTITRKVYRWSSTIMSDVLLYDFSMVVGDTLSTNRGPAIVASIDSLLTYSGYRTRWHFVWTDANGPHPLVIVESLGCLSDPIDYFMLPNFDPQWWVTCFYHHGIKTYGSFCPNHLINFQMFVNPSTCGQCNGSVSIFATFIPDTLLWVPEYSWTPHGPTVIGGLCPLSTGTVLITQTSTNFQYMDWYMIQDNSAPVIQNTSSISASCSSCCDGSISETVTAGVPPYIYSWSPNVSTTNSASGLCPGTYFITVQDSAGCTDIDTINISFTTDIGNVSDPLPHIPSLLKDGEYFVIGNLENESSLSLYDLFGRCVFTTSNYQNDFGMNGIATGTYVVWLRRPNGEIIKRKLVVIK